MKISRTGETFGGFGLSGTHVSPIFAELAGKVAVGQENRSQMDLQGGGGTSPTRQQVSEPDPPTRVLLVYL